MADLTRRGFLGGVGAMLILGGSAGLAAGEEAATASKAALGKGGAAAVPDGPSHAQARLAFKRILGRGKQHQGECYGGVLDEAPGGQAFAYLRVAGKRESLILRPTWDADEFTVAEGKYIWDPCFAGGFLFWAEQADGGWPIRALALGDLGQNHIATPFGGGEWRALSLSACSAGEEAWLAWEERKGVHTRLRMARAGGGRLGEAVALTDGAANAYDPALARTDDGLLYLAYCAFQEGNYRILVQKLSPDGKPLGAPVRVSNDYAACLYPSICARKVGGVWVSYTHLSEPFDAGYVLYPQSARSRAQHEMFLSRGQVTALAFDGERTWGALTSPKQNQGHLADGVVTGASRAYHSRVFEDAEGRLRILFRQHHPKTGEIAFEAGDPPLARSARKGETTPHLTQPDLCMATLMEREWSPVLRFVPNGYLETGLACGLDGDQLRVAFSQDARQTGWWLDGEWYDHDSELGVGVATLELAPLGRPQYEMHPLVIMPLPCASLEERRIEPEDKQGYLHAIGITHKHTTLSVCMREYDRDPHIGYRFMQDVQHSQFGGITDHCHNMWPIEHLLVNKLAAYYYFPGEFVAIPAYEWPSTLTKDNVGYPFGHVNPLYLEEEGELEIYNPGDGKSDDLPQLWKSYEGQRMVMPPHHTSDNLHHFNWDYYHPKFQAVVEIFQDTRGSSESPWAPGVTNYLHAPENHWVLDGLKRGYRMGFIAGGDHCGAARAGVLVKELTRTGLYEALVARRCFGTTGPSMRLRFSCNGQQMGAEIQADKGRFEFAVDAPEPIREFHIVRNGETVEHVAVADKHGRHQWTAQRRERGEFWYCRALMEDGHLAWSSPIWLV